MKDITDDDKCIDWELREAMNFPGDQIIRKIAIMESKLDKSADVIYGEKTFYIEKELHDDYKKQMGSKYTGFVYGLAGKYKLVENIS